MDMIATGAEIATLGQLAPRSRLDRLMGEYERNYERLLYLIPDLKGLKGRYCSRSVGMPDLHVAVIEQSAYTTTLQLSYALSIERSVVDEPQIQLRGYHDARLVEVLAVREPGPGGHPGWCSLRHSSLSRKWRFNRFLGKWLAYCLLQGHGEFVGAESDSVTA